MHLLRCWISVCFILGCSNYSVCFSKKIIRSQVVVFRKMPLGFFLSTQSLSGRKEEQKCLFQMSQGAEIGMRLCLYLSKYFEILKLNL